jgi:hypothetical protein
MRRGPGLAEHEAADRSLEALGIVRGDRVGGLRHDLETTVGEHLVDHPVRDLRRQDVRGGAADDQGGAGYGAEGVPLRLDERLFRSPRRFGSIFSSSNPLSFFRNAYRAMR